MVPGRLLMYIEYKRAVETLSTDNSALAEHVLAEDHHIDWEETTVIGGHPFTNTHCVIESWYINSLPRTINREKGLMPDAVYNSLLKTPCLQHRSNRH